jgi:hypothetical protein
MKSLAIFGVTAAACSLAILSSSNVVKHKQELPQEVPTTQRVTECPKQYTTSVTFEFEFAPEVQEKPVEIKYYPDDTQEGEPAHYIHCGICRQGIITQMSDGSRACSYCGVKIKE